MVALSVFTPAPAACVPVKLPERFDFESVAQRESEKTPFLFSQNSSGFRIKFPNFTKCRPMYVVFSKKQLFLKEDSL